MLNRTVKGIACCLVLILVVGAAYLVYPGTPSKSDTLRFLGYVPLPRGGAVNILDYITVANDYIFVAGMSAGNVSRVPIAGDLSVQRSSLKVLAGKPETHGVVIDPMGHFAFVSRSEENAVDVFDPRTMRLVKTIQVPDDPDGIFYDPHTRLIYVAGGNSNTGTLIDPAQQAVVSTIRLGGKPEFAAVDPQTTLLFQNLKDKNQVLGINLATRAIVGRWPLKGCDGPSGMALDAAQRKLILACSGNARAALFDLITHRVLTTEPVGGEPDSIAVDLGLHRIYTAGKAGVTTVLQQDSSGAMRVIDTIHTHYGAHTLAVDQATHRVYIGYAGLLVGPRLALFDVVKSPQ